MHDLPWSAKIPVVWIDPDQWRRSDGAIWLGCGKPEAIRVLSPGACCGTMVTSHAGSARRPAIPAQVDPSEDRLAGWQVEIGPAIDLRRVRGHQRWSSHRTRKAAMSIRVILTPLFGDDADASVLTAGLGLAQRFGTHLSALFVRLDPSDAVPLVGEGISPAIIEQLTQAAEAEMDRRRGAARSTFETACGTAGIDVVEAPGGARTASAGWREVTGRRDEVIPAKARTSDLVMFARGDERSPPDLPGVLEATLLSGGRPLLLLPPAAPARFGDRVAIAWNGRAEAARAVAGALPFLETASAVPVLTAATRRTPPEVALDLVEYLAWRGIAAERQLVEAKDEAVADALLRAARETGADLLVMGGYGRTRLSELVLGGVTRRVLSHADLPVLIAH
jgi:nucleotide-binding universal stress UspA family protein